MSSMADIEPMSVKTDMYFNADICYSVRYEGRDIAQCGAARRCYPVEA